MTISVTASMTPWARPPARPVLEPADAAVWRLPADAPHPMQSVLAVYLDLPPDEVPLRRSSSGRPELDGGELRVSLAHSGEVALVGIARGREIGVDVEPLRQGVQEWSLPSHALAADERARLDALPVARRSEAFLSIWAQKEALLKAAGVGLAVEPRLIEVGEGPSVLAVPAELGQAADWTLRDLPLDGYVAALALAGPLSRLLVYDARSRPSAPTQP